MKKTSMLMILTLALVLTSTWALAGNSGLGAGKTGPKERSDLWTGFSKKADDCGKRNQKIPISPRESIAGTSSFSGASGCLLSDATKAEVESGELFHIDPQLDKVQMYGY